MKHEYTIRKSAKRVAATSHRTLAALAFSLLGTAAMACDQPNFAAAIPNGKSASESEMAEAQQAVKAYVSAGEAYIACLENESGGSSPVFARLRNETIDGMEKVAANFNRQLRSFRKNS